MGYSRHRDSDTFELTTTGDGFHENKVNIQSSDSREDIESGLDLPRQGQIHVRHDITVDR